LPAGIVVHRLDLSFHGVDVAQGPQGGHCPLGESGEFSQRGL
jgi:hypothetical protein